MEKHHHKDNLKKIALERVKILFDEAGSVFDEDKKLANDYVRKAKKISMKVNLRIPSYLKRQYCKHCDSYLKPGKNLRVRTKNGKVVYYCIECKKFARFKLNPKKSK
ncbi:MAG: ribonuclease P protein component 4 [Nanoarchaeota archaeon]